jgi:DNA-directed RNA polymerase specialized sigma24 family protein
LVTITARKAAAQLRRGHRQKRGGGAVRGESVFVRGHSSERAMGIDQVLGQEPTPELAALISEECEQLMNRLEDESLRRIALLKLEGYSNEEIAEQLDCAPRTVERKLARIRTAWASEEGPE